MYFWYFILFILSSSSFELSICSSLYEDHVSEPLKKLSCCFEEKGFVGLNSTTFSFLASIFMSSLFLLPNFNGLLISRGLNKGFSYCTFVIDFGKFFSFLFISEAIIPKIWFVKLFCCCKLFTSFKFAFMF